ncbi:MAG: hypothetical protein AB1491_13075 [Thermodesulfobacteriota bacterium]
MMASTNWKSWLTRLILTLWGLQVLWLAGHFIPEARNLARRISQGTWGEAVRQEDPFYRWLMRLAQVIPPDATYIFLDNYEAGKEIEARYLLYPRPRILLPPTVPPTFLFYASRCYRATFLLVRDKKVSSGPGMQAVLASPAFTALDLPGPGPAFRVDYSRVQGFFYD